MRRNPRLILGIITLVTIAAAFFVWPGSPLGKWHPWRLGLDLVGGSHLVYKVDLSQVTEGDRTSVLNGLRNVIETRVNLFGVSEPQVFIAESGNETQLIVELAKLNMIGRCASHRLVQRFLSIIQFHQCSFNA